VDILDGIILSTNDEDEDDPEYQLKELVINDAHSPLVNSSATDMDQMKLRINKKKTGVRLSKNISKIN
jgi:hypothetical protein